jgi:hypothetical protein
LRLLFEKKTGARAGTLDTISCRINRAIFLLPYFLKCSKQPAEKLIGGRKKCQGTTSVVPQMQQNKERALAPEGLFQPMNQKSPVFPEPVHPCRK